MKRVLLALLLLVGFAPAKDHPRINIRVVDNSTWNREQRIVIPGRPARSATSCSTLGSANTNGSAYDYGSYTDLNATTTLNATTDCTTTTTPATPATTYSHNIQQVDVKAIMPDGSRATLWCQQAWRYCTALNPGSYETEIDKDTAWVYFTYSDAAKYSRDGTLLPPKVHTTRVKYRVVMSEQPTPTESLRAHYPDIYQLGRAQGYPDKEITEAITEMGAEPTLKFLRDQNEKLKLPAPPVVGLISQREATEAYTIGHELGYSDQEITEALAYDPVKTLEFLRKEKQDKSPKEQ